MQRSELPWLPCRNLNGTKIQCTHDVEYWCYGCDSGCNAPSITAINQPAQCQHYDPCLILHLLVLIILVSRPYLVCIPWVLYTTFYPCYSLSARRYHESYLFSNTYVLLINSYGMHWSTV